ncbi:hypothetical protein CPB86DRAFT_874326 [Serendipita vermifera]|nr:hypothetical protein CPB86DRAFT_874326 [Serendipita vermifera]
MSTVSASKSPEALPLAPPFEQGSEINKQFTWREPDTLVTAPNKFGIQNITGSPLISIEDSDATFEFLRCELLHDRLNALAPIFFFVASPGHADISALHHQIVRGREIIITEDPGLHLLWYYNTIFIKPLPPYLTSHAFWKKFLSGRDTATSALRRAALGYIRSYYYLIQHRSDYDIALDKGLVGRGIEFDDLIYFLHAFRAVADEEVTPRYSYGELRLSRLNFWSRLYRFELFYQKLHGQYGPYFAALVAPLLYVFAIISVTLTAMQTMLSVQQLDLNIAVHSSRVVALVSWWFSICCMLLSSICIVFLPTILFLLLLRELLYSLRHTTRRKPVSGKVKA